MRPFASSRNWQLLSRSLLLISLFFCLAASLWEIAHFSIYTKAFDFNYYRNDALNAFMYGWQTYYTGSDHNIDPPTQGLLLFPFLPFSPQVGFILWTLLSIASIAAIWRLAGSSSWWQLPILILLFPVVYNLLLGQIVIFMALLIVISWWLSNRGHALSAGLVLSLATFKPHLILLLPIALLLSHHRREFVGFALGVLFLVVLSVILVGPSGINAAINTQQYVLSHPRGNYLISAMMLTLWLPGWPGILLSILVALFALYLAHRARRAPVGVVFAIGILASLILTPYLHPQDLVLWVVVALLLSRSALMPAALTTFGLLATWFWVPFSGVLFASPIPFLSLLPLVPLTSIAGLLLVFAFLRQSKSTTLAAPPISRSITIGSHLGA